MYKIKQRKTSDNNILHGFIETFEILAKYLLNIGKVTSQKIDNYFDRYDDNGKQALIFAISYFNINDLDQKDEKIGLLIHYIGYSILGIITSIGMIGLYIFLRIYMFVGVYFVGRYLIKVIRYTISILAIFTSIILVLWLNEYFSKENITSISKIFETGFIEYCVDSIKNLILKR